MTPVSRETFEHAADLAVARHAAELAARMIRDRWDTALEVTHKGEVDLVSEVDLQAEASITATLARAFPYDAIVAEEGGANGTTAARRWHIDPLDGTTNFSHGFPHFCVSIALLIDDEPTVGVIAEPLRGWTFYGTRGGGAWRDGRRLRTASTASLGKALAATGFPYDRRTNPDDNTDRFAKVLKRAQGVRRAGSAAPDLAYLAAGWLDCYWEDRLNSWDLAAGVLLVREAGGVLSGLDGQPCNPLFGHVAAAANRVLHGELLEVLNS